MKKTKKFLVLSLIFGLVLGFFPKTTFAATDKGNENTTVKDGVNVYYDNDSVNGGVSSDMVNSTDEENISLLSVTAAPESVVIYMPFQTQQNDYYCGPAAARMVLGGIGYTVTQSYMASLLGTTTNGTNAGDSVANALNTVASGSEYYFRWQWHTYTNISTIKAHIVEALAHGNPVMVNTVEMPGDVYIAGHNIGTTLYHYGAVADYFDYGNEVTYSDPGYGRYTGFYQDQRLSITNLSYACGGRGYAW